MKKILILGGGFAAISVAQELGKIAKKKKYIKVDLVSEINYFVFQPMLPEVASGGLEASHIINPIRRLCKNVRFHCAKIDAIDIDNKIVRIIGADYTRQQELSYDELVIGMGLSTDFSRVPGMSEHALPMKTLGDAFFLRKNAIIPFSIQNLVVVTSDYHVRRVDIIFKKFFSPHVKVKVIGVDLGLSDDLDLKKNEENSLVAFSKTFKNVEFSSDREICRTLRAMHPFYNGKIYEKIDCD